MQNRQLIINVMSSVAQIIVMGGALFLLYRFLIHSIGVQQIGVWSVVLATASTAQIANLGFTASVVKYVAKYLARDDQEAVSGVIQTSVISIGLAIGLVLLIAYPLISWVLNQVLPTSSLQIALSVLPYALISLWIMVVAGVFQSGLDGYQRIDLRSAMMVAATVVNLIACYMLVPRLGLIGVAYARLIQTGILLVGSWMILKRCLPALPLLPVHWNRKIFSEMLGYGCNFQVSTICQMLYDPVTKTLLTKFGGLEMTGFYEMASRMIMQLRGLPIAANQVLVPAIAELVEKDPEVIGKIYRDSYRLLFYVTLPIFSAVIAFTPLISELWIGHFERIFVLFATMLAVGWFLNTLTTPVYFSNLGTGELYWNTIGYLTIAILNLALGVVLGSFFGGIGVVIAWVCSLVIGSLVIPISYHIKYKISMLELVPMENSGVGVASMTGLFISFLLYHQMVNHLTPLILATIVALVFSAILIMPVWSHPMRKRTFGWISNVYMQSPTVDLEK